MSDTKVLAFRADRPLCLASLAMAAAAALLPLSSAGAADAPPADTPSNTTERMDAPLPGGAVSDTTKQMDAPSPAGPITADVAPDGKIAAPTAALGQGATPDSTVGTSLYGPPAPKVEHGKLPDIEWPAAPQAIPPALEAAINIVTRSYPSARSGRAALRAAASDVKSANWLRFPSVSANLAYLDDSRGAQPQLVVDQPIWTGGRITSNIRRAKAAENSQSAEYVGVVEDLALTVVQTYFQIATLTQREQLLAESLREHLRLVGTMERRVSQEISPDADLELARSRAAQVEQDYTSTQAQRQTALRVLAEFIADPNYDLGPLPVYDASVELPARETLEDQSVAFDPNLRKLASDADVARADYDARKAAILPQLSAQYTNDEFYGSRVGFVVKAQTTGGLAQVSEVNGARLRIDSALEARRQAELRLRRDIASDIIEYDASKARASISTRASDTAARVSESYTRQFIAGRRSWLDVMNALREAVTAQIGKTDAEQAALSASARLTLRSGRWRPNFDGPGQGATDEKQANAMAAM